LAIFEEHDEHESAIGAFVEPLVILMILIANAAVGVWQVSAQQNVNSNKSSVILILFTNIRKEMPKALSKHLKNTNPKLLK
jgi:hypothetical protein